MKRPYEYPGGFLMTKKKAVALAVQELGTAKGLEQESGMFKGLFLMHLGQMEVRILPDVYTNSGKIALVVEMPNVTERIFCFYDRDTLERDDHLVWKYYKRLRREDLKEWVDNYGEEYCHAEIDRIADELR